MKFTFTRTVIVPGQTSTINTPFGPKTITTQDSETVTTEVWDLDSANQAIIAALLSGAQPVHLTASELKAVYTQAELIAALQSV